MKNKFFLIILGLSTVSYCIGQTKSTVQFIKNDGKRLMLEIKLRSSIDGFVIPSDGDSYYFNCKGPSGKIELRKSEIDSIIVGTTVYQRAKFYGKDIFGFFTTTGKVDVFKFYDYSTGEIIGFNGVPTQSLNKYVTTTLLKKEGDLLKQINWQEYLINLEKESSQFKEFYKKVKKKWRTESVEKSLIFYNENCE